MNPRHPGRFVPDGVAPGRRRVCPLSRRDSHMRGGEPTRGSSCPLAPGRRSREHPRKPVRPPGPAGHRGHALVAAALRIARLAHRMREVYKEDMAGRYGRPRSVLRMRTVAGQVFLLQVAIVVLLVAAAIAALVLQSRSDADREARNRSVAVAEAFANAPGIEAALKSAHPTTVLQPRTEAARKRSEVDFIVVMNTQGIRYTHPIPNRIGKKFVGTLQPALAAWGGHREDHRHHRSAGPGRGPGLQPQRPGQGKGHRAGLRRDHRQPCERCRRRPVPAAVRRRGRRPRADHQRHRTGQQAAAAPDPRPRPGRDDPDVRAPRCGSARRARGRDHRGRGRFSAARQRRGAPACWACRRTSKDARSPISGSTPPPPICWPPAGSSPMRSTRSATGCWPSTSARRTRPAGRPAASRRCGTAPSSAR